MSDLFQNAMPPEAAYKSKAKFVIPLDKIQFNQRRVSHYNQQKPQSFTVATAEDLQSDNDG